jgi:hypothetical protein
MNESSDDDDMHFLAFDNFVIPLLSGCCTTLFLLYYTPSFVYARLGHTRMFAIVILYFVLYYHDSCGLSVRPGQALQQSMYHISGRL